MAYLGIDGGGSGSRWLLLEDEANLLAQGEGPPLQLTRFGPVEVAARLNEMLARVREAGVEPSCLVVSLAGAGDVNSRKRLEKILRDLSEDHPAYLVSDPVAAAGVALREGAGVAVWSGTGSFAVARDAEGGLHRAGGRGNFLGDQGSAYAIGRAGGKLVLEAAEGIRQETALTELYATALELGDPMQVGKVMEALEACGLAALSTLVIEAAENGDEQASSILRAAAEDLAPVVRAAARSAAIASTDLELACGGGVFKSRTYGSRLASALQDLGIVVNWRLADEAVRGAALLAMDVTLQREPFSNWVKYGSPA
ncbi:MAG: N-acetylglucosamine kinase [Planctomycetota bacterium]|jgi:N-acetylglucosamine kinase-like BadF-type ATPase